jgi:erythromycin esterase-like protein
MKNNIVFLFCLFSIVIIAQDFNPKTLSLPENVSAKDLVFLKDELKDVRVVLLGEKTHDDGNVFEMKTKIIEFLYKEMGFKTIAFESGVYDVWKAQKSINKNENVNEALKKSLFAIWAKKNEFQSFVEFYDKNKSDLKLFGFDNQLTGKFGQEELVEDLYDYCKKIHFNFKLKKEDFDLLIESMLNSYMFDEEDITFEQYKNTLSQLLLKIEKQPESEEHFYWRQTVKSLLVLGEQYLEGYQTISTFYTSVSDNIRDKQMADNLLAYLKENPNEKVICWGANVHFANDMTSVTTPIVKEFIPMGSYIKKHLKNKAYSLAAVTASDSIYLQNKWNNTPIDSNSFETYLKTSNSNKSFVFISSNQVEMKKPQLNRLFSPITFIESRLDLMHDGYLYFDEVILSTPIIESVIEDEVKVNVKITGDNSSFEFQDESLETTLNEVIVYGKRVPYQIIKKVIENFEMNYPGSKFSSTMYSNVKTNIQDALSLDFEFVANEFDVGYVKHNYRSLKIINEIKWNIKKGYEPKTLREFYGLVYNSPIKYAPFLSNRKFQKFLFILEETKMYNNQEVYIISFSSLRNHSNFTSRVYPSNYSGYLYVNKKDHAIVKIFENWEILEFPIQFESAHVYNKPYEKFIKNKYTNESTYTEFSKVDNQYYISHSINIISGNIFDKENNTLPFETKISSYWSNFNSVNPVKIANKDEQHLFGKVKYNEAFWKTFKIPFLK